jgi:hypothetical protein
VAIVAVTASAFDEARDAIFEAGADGWLRKPCREDEILDEIQRHLGITYRYAARRTSTPGMAAVTGRPSAFGSLPPALTTEICNAAHLADYQRLTELIAELRGEHAAAAEALHRLTEAFAYEQIESQAKQGQVREEPSTTENAAVVGYPTGVGASSNPAPRR